MSIVEKKETSLGTFFTQLRPIVKEDLIVYASSNRLHVTNMEELTGIKFAPVSIMLDSPEVSPGPNMEKRRVRRIISLLGADYTTSRAIDSNMPHPFDTNIVAAANETVSRYITYENDAAKRNMLERIGSATDWVKGDFPAIEEAIEKADIEYKLARAKLAAAKDMLHKKALEEVIKHIEEKGLTAFIPEAEVRKVERYSSPFGGV